MRHILKTWPEPFQAAWAGQKPFELRPDNRVPRFAVGDRVILQEWDPSTDSEMPRYVSAKVGYVARDRPEWGLRPGHCILGLVEEVYRDGPWSESGHDFAAAQSVHASPAPAPPDPEGPPGINWAALDLLDRLAGAVNAAILTGRFPDPAPPVTEALADVDALLTLSLQAGPAAAGKAVPDGR